MGAYSPSGARALGARGAAVGARQLGARGVALYTSCDGASSALGALGDRITALITHHGGDNVRPV